ncbi:hypothetical protein NMY22_g4917 [Coprinellus aureogranulatus]|nr:hypothetical protein NMY22_g4917 [Coprinellus aureogranulatus]
MATEQGCCQWNIEQAVRLYPELKKKHRMEGDYVHRMYLRLDDDGKPVVKADGEGGHALSEDSEVEEDGERREPSAENDSEEDVHIDKHTPKESPPCLEDRHQEKNAYAEVIVAVDPRNPGRVLAVSTHVPELGDITLIGKPRCGSSRTDRQDANGEWDIHLCPDGDFAGMRIPLNGYTARKYGIAWSRVSVSSILLEDHNTTCSFFLSLAATTLLKAFHSSISISAMGTPHAVDNSPNGPSISDGLQVQDPLVLAERGEHPSGTVTEGGDLVEDVEESQAEVPFDAQAEGISDSASDCTTESVDSASADAEADSPEHQGLPEAIPRHYELAQEFIQWCRQAKGVDISEIDNSSMHFEDLRNGHICLAFAVSKDGRDTLMDLEADDADLALGGMIIIEDPKEWRICWGTVRNEEQKKELAEWRTPDGEECATLRRTHSWLLEDTEELQLDEGYASEED